MPIEQKYNVFKISKRNGKFRTIYAPQDQYMRWLKSKVFELNCLVALKEEEIIQDLSLQNDYLHGFLHGFMHGKSPVTNAMVHKGSKYILSVDLENFFDAVGMAQVGSIPGFYGDDFELLFIKSIARQGMPTSPALANLAFLKYDDLLLKNLQFGYNEIGYVKYTRYADDLTFSFNATSMSRATEIKQFLLNIIEKVLVHSPFTINEKKTEFQSAQGGNMFVTGVAINPKTKTVTAPRKVRRKLRAAMHQGNIHSYNGLNEFVKTKVPMMHGCIAGLNTALSRARVLKLNVSKENVTKLRKPQWAMADGSFIRSTHLMDFFKRQCSSGVINGETDYLSFVPFLLGSEIWYDEFNKANAVVLTLECGKKFYSTISGSHDAVEKLRVMLRSKGIISLDQCRQTYRGHFVMGEVKGQFDFKIKGLKLTDGVKKTRVKPKTRLMVV